MNPGCRGTPEGCDTRAATPGATVGCMEQVPFERGESAIAVPVPAAEPLVSPWRARFDSSAAYGVPAHVTVVSPFLPDALLSASVLEALRAECAKTAPFEVTFSRVGRFTGVLYLAPEPTRGFRDLTARLVERWPEAPPYGGKHEDVVPHLTVADAATDAALEAAERDLRPKLPLKTTVDAADLSVFDGRRWHVRERLPFLGASDEA